ncbi:MAG: stage III sporulation protein AF [Clostridiaceae bacterium]|nr:stage III sporulation protein AF [Clostridiaceae bacterium]
MNMLREWIITITSVIIFITFVEILVPNSNNKRYVNVVVGILIMIVILNPLFHLLRQDINLEEGILKASSEIEYRAMSNRMDSNMSVMQKEAVIELYKTKLIDQMKHRLNSTTNYIVQDIKLEVEETDEEKFGTINKLDIVLQDSKKPETPETKHIEPVNIQVSINKNNNTAETHSILLSNEEKEIRNSFSIYYDVPKENINIHILKDK